MNAPETITIDEVTVLLKSAASRDQRTIDTADTLAWWQDLNTARVSYQDASVALSHYYANVWPRQDPRQRFRATAPVLIELVIQIRKQRLADSNFVYQPRHPDESGAQYVERLRRQIAAVAAGQAPPDAPNALRVRPVAELVASAVGKWSLPPEIADVLGRRRPAARSITCPYCNAQKGSNCKNPVGKDVPGGVHPTRVDAWATAIAGCPVCRAAPGEPCTETDNAGVKPYTHGTHHDRVETAQTTPTQPQESQ